MKIKSKSLGNKGEQLACDYLARKNIEIIARNCRTPRGEIDIIAKDGDVIVFVEVKTKTSDCLGSAAEMVGRQKQQKLVVLAESYMVENNLDADFRIDVIAIDYSQTVPEIDWIKSAVEK